MTPTEANKMQGINTPAAETLANSLEELLSHPEIVKQLADLLKGIGSATIDGRKILQAFETIKLYHRMKYK